MKVILDTNVYIDATRSELGWKRFEKHIIPCLPFIHLCSVVAFELKCAQRKKEDELLLFRHIESLEKVGRLITPTFEDWTLASKLRSSLCDVLIGCCARRIGAMVLTSDFKDFLPLAKALGFEIKRPW